MTRNTLGATVMLAIATGAGAPRLMAQPALIAMRGMVIDKQTSAALADVQVSIIGGAVRVTTDAEGVFTLASPVPGPLVLSFRRLGFRAGTLTVDRVVGDTMTVRFEMERVAQRLREVNVRTDREIVANARLAGFEERRTRGLGRYITEEEIERKGVMRTSDLLRAVLSIDVRKTADGETIIFSRRGMKLQPGTGRPVECPIPILVDGGMRIADLEHVSTKDIAGVEIYSGPGTVPPQYKSMSNNTQCGLVMIWTRSGSMRR